MATKTAPPPPRQMYETRSAVRSSRIAFGALLLRDLVVLRKHLREFIPRTIVQPLLLCFVFLYVFPTIGTGVGGRGGAAGESAFATTLVAGVVGLTIMFQGIQAVALPMVQEFGYTKEIEDRVLAPLPVALVALEKVAFGAIQGMLAACIVFPIAAVVHARSIHINLSVHWAVLVTLVPLACVACSALGLTFGTIFDPRNVPLMFGIIILPLTFLGGTYYAWTTLSPVTLWGVHWLQILVLVNPLVYINEGSRAALTTSGHMVAVGYLPGPDRVHRVLPVAGHVQLPAARDQLGGVRRPRVPCYLRPARRGGGAVERTGLENRQWPSRSFVGSNPTPAAEVAVGAYG